MKAIFFDLDGTLLNQEHQISPFNQRVLSVLMKKGKYICLASGRTYHSMLPFYHTLKLTTPLISYNGAKVVYQKEEIDETPLPPEVVDHLLDISRIQQLHLNLYHQEVWYTERPDSLESRRYSEIAHLLPQYLNMDILAGQSFTKALFIAPAEQILAIKPLVEERLHGQISTTSSMRNFLEILAPQVNKGQAIKKVCAYLNIDLKETMAFGDGLNDLEMIKTVQCGVAMGNARSQLKTVADDTALFNTEDGVGQYLNSYYNLGLVR